MAPRRMAGMMCMAGVIVCPDCGGVISGEAPEGVKACRCAQESLAGAGTVPPPAREKTCCRCGKDINGKTRYHDSRGYWCKECHRLDKLATAPQGEPCAACTRRVPPAKLYADQGQRICGRCLREREEARRKPKAITFSRPHQEYEKKQVLIRLAIALALVLLVILASSGLFR